MKTILVMPTGAGKKFIMQNQKFKKGTKVRLDANIRGGFVVEIVDQTTNLIFSRVKAQNSYEWDVITRRLTSLND